MRLHCLNADNAVGEIREYNLARPLDRKRSEPSMPRYWKDTMFGIESHLREAHSLAEQLPNVHDGDPLADRYRQAEQRLREEINELRWLAKGMADGSIEQVWDAEIEGSED
jgi:hypothetical protein